MDLLNIAAQVVVLIAIFLWTVLKAAWNLFFLVWEIIRDYSPLLAKKVLKVSKKIGRFLSKQAQFIWTATQAGFNRVKELMSLYLEKRTRQHGSLPDNSLMGSAIGSTEAFVFQSPTQAIPVSTVAQESIIYPVLDQPTRLSDRAASAQLLVLITNIVKKATRGLSYLASRAIQGLTLIRLWGARLSLSFSHTLSNNIGLLSAGVNGFVLIIVSSGLKLLWSISTIVVKILFVQVPKVMLSVIQVTLSQVMSVTSIVLGGVLIGIKSIQSLVRTHFWSKSVENTQFSLKKTEIPFSIPVHFILSKFRTTTPTSLSTKRIFSKLSLAGTLVSCIALVFIFFPEFVFAIVPYQTEPIESAVDESALGGRFIDGNLYSQAQLPEQNPYLPEGNWLVIPKIGVLTQINESSTEDHEDALKKGVWRVPEFANPTEGRNDPTILVAHKFGYLSWSNKFRRQNSFYNLEELEIGDTFEIIWDKRRFTYEIYAGEEGKDITDYKADVVLYTCKYLNSPARIFRYARRVEY